MQPSVLVTVPVAACKRGLTVKRVPNVWTKSWTYCCLQNGPFRFVENRADPLAVSIFVAVIPTGIIVTKTATDNRRVKYSMYTKSFSLEAEEAMIHQRFSLDTARASTPHWPVHVNSPRACNHQRWFTVLLAARTRGLTCSTPCLYFPNLGGIT